MDTIEQFRFGEMTFYLLSNKRRPELSPRIPLLADLTYRSDCNVVNPLTSFLLHRFDLNVRHRGSFASASVSFDFPMVRVAVLRVSNRSF
jgi:hypothetical protein